MSKRSGRPIEDFEHHHTSEPLCPHCLYEFKDSGDLADEDELECPECGGECKVYRQVSCTYSTDPIKGEPS